MLFLYCHQRIRLLEEKISNLTEELNAARQLKPTVSSDALEQLERRLQRAENDLVAGDVLRDNLRSDREKVTCISLAFSACNVKVVVSNAPFYLRKVD